MRHPTDIGLFCLPHLTAAFFTRYSPGIGLHLKTGMKKIHPVAFLHFSMKEDHRMHISQHISPS